MKNIQIEYLYTTQGKLYQIRVHHRGRTEIFDATDENMRHLIDTYNADVVYQTHYLHDHDVLDHNGVIIDMA